MNGTAGAGPEELNRGIEKAVTAVTEELRVLGNGAIVTPP
jgi:hypothetical protein